MTESKKENINTKSVNPDASQLGFCMYVCMYYLSIDTSLSICLSIGLHCVQRKAKIFFSFFLSFLNQGC